MDRRITPQERYDKKNRVAFFFRFNKRTDAKVIEKLQSVENKQGYIKGLIMDDIRIKKEKYKTAAEAAGLSLNEWVERTLDAAAGIDYN